MSNLSKMTTKTLLTPQNGSFWFMIPYNGQKRRVFVPKEPQNAVQNLVTAVIFAHIGACATCGAVAKIIYFTFLGKKVYKSCKML